MNKILSVLMLGISCLTVVSCSKKNGDTTIIERQNDVGTIIHSGASDPTATIGKDGDFYINLSTGALFGPKKVGKWGIGLILSGDAGKDGSNGKDGNTIIHGKGAPNSTMGNIGDFYFDTENVTIYGAKTSLGWGTPINLKPEQDSGVRVLIKEAPKVKLMTNADGTPIINTHSYFENRINMGDISSYYNEGAVLVQVKINNSGWSSNEGYIEINNSDYNYSVVCIVGNNTFYNNDYFIFSTNAYSFQDKSGTKDQDVLLKRIKGELDKTTIAYKFILIPPSTVRKLAKRFPKEKISEQFLTRYLSLAR